MSVQRKAPKGRVGRVVRPKAAKPASMKSFASVGTIAAMLATVVSGLSYAAGDTFAGAGSPLHLAWIPFLQQNADVGTGAGTIVDSMINAGSANETGILQSGGAYTGFSFQNADAGNTAATGVDNTINAGAANSAALLQLGGGSLLWSSQDAGVGAGALTDVHSVVNAGSLNGTGIAQIGSGVQDASVSNTALTGVDSDINAGSLNAAGIYMGNIPYMAGPSAPVFTPATGGGYGVTSSQGSTSVPCTTGCTPPPCTTGCTPNPPCTSGCGGADAGNQNSTVLALAGTNVDSANNSHAGNDTTVVQLSNGGAFQDASVGNVAVSDLDSTINAGSMNNVGIAQIGGGVASVLALAGTDVDSTNNSHAGNDTTIVQHSTGGGWSWCGGCSLGLGGFQDADATNVAVSDLDSTINAGSQNNIGVLQLGGPVSHGTQSQYADVAAGASTDVNSVNNSGAHNDTTIVQNYTGWIGGHPCGYGCGGLGGGLQDADAVNVAVSDLDSEINAGSENNIDVAQVGGSVSHGAQAQYASVNAPSSTTVNSTNNSGAQNELGIFQNASGNGFSAQDADATNVAVSDLDSTINAGAQNNIGVLQTGGSVNHGAAAQYVEVNAPATTTVNSTNNSGASNETGILQNSQAGSGCGGCGGGSFQDADAVNVAVSDLDSTINAQSQNNIGINQVGGNVNHGAQAQYIEVNAPASTTVNSTNNSNAENDLGIFQNAMGGGGVQTADADNTAVSDLDSTINAGSQNNIGINQIGGNVNHGASAQYIEVNAPASTTVNSQNNSGASNETGILQNSQGGSGCVSGCVSVPVQNADADSTAVSDLDSTINAGSQNNIQVNQIGGNVDHGASAQYVEVNAPASTTVNSENNSGASNDTGIVQNGVNAYGASCGHGGCSLTAPGVQNADANSAAASDLDSEINAGSQNNVEVTQVGGDGDCGCEGGNNQQSAVVNSSAGTNVNSTNNAGSANMTEILQNMGF